LHLECDSISILDLDHDLIRLFSTERGKRDFENWMID